MMRSLWIAKTGLDAQQTQLDVISNNLANVSTNGFKRSRTVFEDLLYQSIRPAGAQANQQNQVPTGLEIGTGVRPVATVRNYTQGSLQLTGNALDLAINGNGFFQVQRPDGVAYTRDGSFQVNNEGQLVTSNGLLVGEEPITIPPDAQAITVAPDGTVSASVIENGVLTVQQLGQLQIVTFINPAGLAPLGTNLFAESAASGAPAVNVPGTAGAGVINQGYVEASNVNVVEELVSLIQTQRAYEINSRAISTSDQMLQRITQL
jgi:flagellar basal-body rod protein FlgG